MPNTKAIEHPKTVAVLKRYERRLRRIAAHRSRKPYKEAHLEAARLLHSLIEAA